MFYREKQLKGNGDFFHVAKGCGSVNHNGCEFFGQRDRNGMSTTKKVFIVCVVCVVAAVVIAFFVSRRRSKKNRSALASQDIESGPSAPLIRPSRKSVRKEEVSSEETGSEDEYTESEEESVEKSKPKRVFHHSATSSESEESSEEESSDDEAEIVPQSVFRARGKAAVVEKTEPIGVRSAKEKRALVRRRNVRI